MKNVIISYEMVSPAILNKEITAKCGNALCMWKDLNEDYFEFEVVGWLPFTPADLVRIEEILAQYV